MAGLSSRGQADSDVAAQRRHWGEAREPAVRPHAQSFLGGPSLLFFLPCERELPVTVGQGKWPSVRKLWADLFKKPVLSGLPSPATAPQRVQRRNRDTCVQKPV